LDRTVTTRARVSEARELHARGWSIRRIGRHIGASQSLVYRWLHPERWPLDFDDDELAPSTPLPAWVRFADEPASLAPACGAKRAAAAVFASEVGSSMGWAA
jgi:hypothetical protein